MAYGVSHVRRGWIRAGKSFLSIVAIFSMFIAPSSSALLAAGGNLVSNGDLAQASGSSPIDWSADSWGINTPVFNYPAAGFDSYKAAETTLTARENGDAKWNFKPVAVIPGKQYEYSDYYTSDVESLITNEYVMQDGSYKYQYVATLNPARAFSQSRVRFTVPAGAQTVSTFHYIQSVGKLTIAKVDLHEYDAPVVPPSDPGNLIPNPSLLEPAPSGTEPAGWHSNIWQSSTANFSYLPAGYKADVRGVRVDITNYTAGDAKWYHDEIPVTAGEAYEFSDYYQSDRATALNIRFRMSDGQYIYPDLGNIASSPSWQQYSAKFTVPAGAVGMTVFHLIEGKGYLETSGYSIKKAAVEPPTGGGMLSLNFDDGWMSAYDNAFPVLDELGLRGTSYVITNALDPNFNGYMRPSHVLSLAARGHEIGAHTRSHAHLNSLSGNDLQSEVTGSKLDLEALGIDRVESFAYPYGEYNSNAVQAAKDAGFLTARTTEDGYNAIGQDAYRLKSLSVDQPTTLAQAKNQIDQAMRDKNWLVLVFHRVQDNSSDFYSTTPTTFRQIAEYVKSTGIKVVTMAEGVQALAR